MIGIIDSHIILHQHLAVFVILLMLPASLAWLRLERTQLGKLSTQSRSLGAPYSRTRLKAAGGRRRISSAPTSQTIQHWPQHIDSMFAEVHSNYFLSLPSNESSLKATDPGLVLVLLNTQSWMAGRTRSVLLPSLWSMAKVKICADGGANRLFDSFSAAERLHYVPDLIKGDLDSLRQDVREFYCSNGTRIVMDHDQDHNDLSKCLEEVESGATSVSPDATVLALGAFGGRFDQEMAAFHVLHSYPNMKLILLDEANLSFLLRPGLRHRIRPDRRFEGPVCGLIPLAGAAKQVYTRGLQWNLNGEELAFGVMVSSSNRVDQDEIEVVTDAPLVWTTELDIDAWSKAMVLDSPDKPAR